MHNLSPQRSRAPFLPLAIKIGDPPDGFPTSLKSKASGKPDAGLFETLARNLSPEGAAKLLR